MLPYCFTFGQCLESIFRQNGLISICHRHCIPARSKPKSMPPIPENTLPNLTDASWTRPQNWPSPLFRPCEAKLLLADHQIPSVQDFPHHIDSVLVFKIDQIGLAVSQIVERRRFLR